MFISNRVSTRIIKHQDLIWNVWERWDYKRQTYSHRTSWLAEANSLKGNIGNLSIDSYKNAKERGYGNCDVNILLLTSSLVLLSLFSCNFISYNFTILLCVQSETLSINWDFLISILVPLQYSIYLWGFDNNKNKMNILFDDKLFKYAG